MEKRTNESPMDFEWQTKAPGDVTSPFYQLAMEHEKSGNKRPFSVFNSPTKTFTEPNQRFEFSQPLDTTPAFHPNPAFATPRKLDFDFSSGPENSPDTHVDNDETPEPPSKSDRRNSLFNFYGRFAPSPGRGEIPRIDRFANVAIRRVQKRRKREREVERHLRKVSEADSVSTARERYTRRDKPPREGIQKHQDIPFFSRLFTFLESHPHIPRILSYYVQFTFNLVLAFLALYVIVAFLLAIKHDMDRTREGVSADILAEMATCTKNYVENRCSGEDGRRLPALEAVCNNWERCMNQDPAKVGKAKVSAQTLAEVLNGFIEPISFKTMIFFIASITSCVAVSNLTFSFFRNKSNNPPESMPSRRPFTPPSMYPSSSQVAFTSGHSGFGMGAPGYAPYSVQGIIPPFDMSPVKCTDTDEHQRQIDFGQFTRRVQTPSPSKRESKFA
ncbi:nuclear envelope protein Brr6 [Coccidioides immitis H538.4]|uniref:Nuclear envelope protein Brr6 n=2 Tax=Coccidioides immitis TaxID=5501 RepID=A0A0J8RSD2_COCIT|nr:bad response to refrigeration protein 6 [Coccidioides immitis RMSCC 2394]KMU86849.1 nuclear envelope protein Brr6 [Coccidioides immitis H538.4]